MPVKRTMSQELLPDNVTPLQPGDAAAGINLSSPEYYITPSPEPDAVQSPGSGTSSQRGIPAAGAAHVPADFQQQYGRVL